MLGYFEIVSLYLKKNILYEGKERTAKTKLMPAKLRAVFFNFEFPQMFQKINIWGYSFSDIFMFFVKFDSESLISRISLRKRIFMRNHFNLDIRGPDGLD